jgi:hypothetical protein
VNGDYLKHYGILGMHWGRRKTSNVTIARIDASEDHNKKVVLKNKSLHQMTNDELRTYTQRMMLEKQFKELSKNDISRGKKIVNTIIDKATKGATDAALNYVNKQTAKMVDDLIKKVTTKAAP